ncbi:MAG: radical SAM protein, partial [Bdellovibrionota bacterium]
MHLGTDLPTMTVAPIPAASVETGDGTGFYIPEEFLPLAEDPNSLTSKMAARFGVEPRAFLNWRWHMKNQVTDGAAAAKVLDLKEQESRGFQELGHLFNAGITPYYMGLMLPRLDEDECPIRLQALPRIEELKDSLGVADPLSEVAHSPVREVVQVYPDRVAFCVAQLCPVYCRYCFRKRRDEEVGLHFNRAIIDRGIEYIAANPAIRDVLITGGDSFVASDAAIESLLERIRAIPHVEIIRFGTRTPVTLPYRVTDRLAKILAKYHPVFVNTHF